MMRASSAAIAVVKLVVLYLTIMNIINKCGDYFHIIIIDDESFCKLLENNCMDLNKVGDPIKANLRTLNIKTYCQPVIVNLFA